MRTRWVGPAVLTLAALGPTALGPAASAGPAPAAAAPGWVRVTAPHVSGRDERPQAVVAVGPSDVWAIGYSVTSVGGATEFRTLAEHVVGSRATIVPTPDRETAPAQDFLSGAAASGPADVWAVGTSVGSGTPDQSLIEHWDGATWTLLPSPDAGMHSDSLQAVTATSPSDAWAVGARVPGGQLYQAPWTLHWDGTTWRSVAVPRVPGCTGHSTLTAVTAVGARSLWATGWCGSGGSQPERGYVLHGDGRTWSVAAVVPQRAAPSSETYGIAARSDHDVWVVGFSRRASDRAGVPLTYHLDGVAWRVVAGPPGAHSLAAVTAGRAGVWAVGDGPSPQPPFAGPAAAQLGGGAWHDRRVPVGFGLLSGVTTAPDGVVWAAGMQILPDGTDTALLVHR